MADLEKLQTFRKRMEKLGIDVQLMGNYPWIYIDSVNGNRIKREDYFYADHGFTIGFLPIKPDVEFHFTDITEIFKLIRKYK
jgi:hypothetical protein